MVEVRAVSHRKLPRSVGGAEDLILFPLDRCRDAPISAAGVGCRLETLEDVFVSSPSIRANGKPPHADDGGTVDTSVHSERGQASHANGEWAELHHETPFLSHAATTRARADGQLPHASDGGMADTSVH